MLSEWLLGSGSGVSGGTLAAGCLAAGGLLGGGSGLGGRLLGARRRLSAGDFLDDALAGENLDDAARGGPPTLTARHLFCLAADALVLPQSTADAPAPSAPHCDVGSLEVRDELLYLWSSARSQIPEDVIERTLRRATEHRETLRGHEVHAWYPDGDKGTEGMLRVLNSGWEGRASYNFDSEPADSSHDDLYRFHSRE